LEGWSEERTAWSALRLLVGHSHRSSFDLGWRGIRFAPVSRLNARVHILLALETTAMTQLLSHAESGRVRWRFFVWFLPVAGILSGPYRRSAVATGSVL